MKTYRFHVYILTNAGNKVFYIGFTNDLERRCNEHKSRSIDGFTKKYNVHKLVYFEEFDNAITAIAREKQLKGLLRKKKIDLIQEFNPKWEDLYLNKRIKLPSKNALDSDK
jgi:putative endonuclease